MKEINQSKKQIIDNLYYQKHKEEKKQARRERYAKEKKRGKKQVGKYSRASAYKVLMSLKDYTELNQNKHKNWVEFMLVLQDLANIGINNIADIMRLQELAENLITDYWLTAKAEKQEQAKSWNSLSEEQKARLIKYWGQEKARIENGYLETAEELERKSQKYLAEIELAKFHEEQGKIKCPCYSCESKQEVKAKIAKEAKELEEQETETKGKCFMCDKVRKLDEEEVCKNCSAFYE